MRAAAIRGWLDNIISAAAGLPVALAFATIAQKATERNMLGHGIWYMIYLVVLYLAWAITILFLFDAFDYLSQSPGTKAVLGVMAALFNIIVLINIVLTGVHYPIPIHTRLGVARSLLGLSGAEVALTIGWLRRWRVVRPDASIPSAILLAATFLIGIYLIFFLDL